MHSLTHSLDLICFPNLCQQTIVCKTFWKNHPQQHQPELQQQPQLPLELQHFVVKIAFICFLCSFVNKTNFIFFSFFDNKKVFSGPNKKQKNAVYKIGKIITQVLKHQFNAYFKFDNLKSRDIALNFITRTKRFRAKFFRDGFASILLIGAKKSVH